MFSNLSRNETSNQFEVDSSNNHRRFEWKNRFDLIIICSCLTLNVGTFAREPYLAYRYGGVVPYFIPYIFLNVFLGYPLLFFELSLGQFMKTGRQAIERLCPLMKGVTFVQLLISIGHVIISFVMVSYSLHYLYKICTPSSSMDQWGTCDNYWNTPECIPSNSANGENEIGKYVPMRNVSAYNHSISINLESTNPAQEYFENTFLQKAKCNVPQSVSIPVISSMIVAILITYLLICQGIKWLNNIIYGIIVAIFFFYFIFAIITFALLPHSSGKGLQWMFHSNFSHWLDYGFWKTMIVGILYRYGIGGGVLMSLGSYTKFNNKLHYDCIFIVIFNIVITFISMVLITEFNVKMSIHLGRSFSDVMTSGFYFYFISVPQFGSFLHPSATSTAMCVSAFLLATLISIAQVIIPLETIFTTFEDAYEKLRKRYYREISRLIICVVLLLICIPFSLNCGSQLLMIINWYMFNASSLSVVCFFQVISISWVYGIMKYLNDIELMIGKLNFFKIILFAMFAVIIPIILFALFVMATAGGYYFDAGIVTTLGNMVRSLCIVYVPVYMIFAALALPRFCKKRCSYLTASEYPLHVKIAGNVNAAVGCVAMEPL